MAALSLFTASSQNAYCPVAALSLFTARRGQSEGPLFCGPDLSLTTPSQLNSWLSGSLSWASLHQLNIKAHSFRIGPATHASAQGYSDSQIQRMGRWVSSTFQKIYSYHLFRNTVSFHCHIFFSLALGGVGRRWEACSFPSLPFRWGVSSYLVFAQLFSCWPGVGVQYRTIPLLQTHCSEELILIIYTLLFPLPLYQLTL